MQGSEGSRSISKRSKCQTPLDRANLEQQSEMPCVNHSIQTVKFMQRSFDVQSESPDSKQLQQQVTGTNKILWVVPHAIDRQLCKLFSQGKQQQLLGECKLFQRSNEASEFQTVLKWEREPVVKVEPVEEQQQNPVKIEAELAESEIPRRRNRRRRRAR